jgi:zinc transporter
MNTPLLSPIAAFDILGKDQAVPLAEPWPGLAPPEGYRWLHLDLNDPQIAAWAHDMLPPVASSALMQSETQPRCDRLENGLILNLRGVNLNPDSDPEDMVSLRLWVNETSIVTARLRKVWALDAMRQSALSGVVPGSIGSFLVELTKGLTKRIETVSLDLEARTDMLEDAVFDGNFPPSDELASLRQAVIKMRRFITPQRDAIAALAQLDNWVIEQTESTELREAANLTKRIVEELDATRERLQALQDQLDANRSQALSRHSYLLSVVAAIFLPLGFLTGLFGVNVAGIPGVENPMAFLWLAGVSVMLGLVLFLIFKIADWL